MRGRSERTSTRATSMAWRTPFPPSRMPASIELSIKLVVCLNTGTLNATISSPNTTAPGYSLTVANNGFTGTCPFTINYLTEASASGGIPANTANITAGLYLAKPPATSYNGINLSSSAASHPLPACRIYYSQITIQPALAEEYILNNRAKKCIYRTVLTNQYNNLPAAKTLF